VFGSETGTLMVDESQAATRTVQSSVKTLKHADVKQQIMPNEKTSGFLGYERNW
jgi:hypothetical protein